MKQNVFIFSFLLIMCFNHSVIEQVSADQLVWTEKKLGRAILKAEKAAQQKKWTQAIIRWGTGTFGRAGPQQTK